MKSPRGKNGGRRASISLLSRLLFVLWEVYATQVGVLTLCGLPGSHHGLGVKKYR